MNLKGSVQIKRVGVYIIIIKHFCTDIYPLPDSGAIVDGKTKLILGLIWKLILHYSISMPNTDGKQQQETNVKALLLSWINDKVSNIVIKNFRTDWQDGRAIGALVDGVAPGKNLCFVLVTSTCLCYTVDIYMSACTWR